MILFGGKVEKIKLLIADDHPMLREGLKRTFEGEEGFLIVAEAQTKEEAIEKTKRFLPQVILMDLRMPQPGDGIAASQEIKKSFPQVKIIWLTLYQTEEEIHALKEVGVEGYLLKDAPAEEIVKAVIAVNQGGSALHPTIAKKVLGRLRQDSKENSLLSPREKEVLKYLAKGYKNKEIAQELWVSEATVKAHVSKVLQKLECQDRTQAIVKAVRLGLVSLKE